MCPTTVLNLRTNSLQTPLVNLMKTAKLFDMKLKGLLGLKNLIKIINENERVKY